MDLPRCPASVPAAGGPTADRAAADGPASQRQLQRTDLPRRHSLHHWYAGIGRARSHSDHAAQQMRAVASPPRCGADPQRGVPGELPRGVPGGLVHEDADGPPGEPPPNFFVGDYDGQAQEELAAIRAICADYLEEHILPVLTSMQQAQGRLQAQLAEVQQRLQAHQPGGVPVEGGTGESPLCGGEAAALAGDAPAAGADCAAGAEVPAPRMQRHEAPSGEAEHQRPRGARQPLEELGLLGQQVRALQGDVLRVEAQVAALQPAPLVPRLFQADLCAAAPAPEAAAACSLEGAARSSFGATPASWQAARPASREVFQSGGEFGTVFKIVPVGGTSGSEPQKSVQEMRVEAAIAQELSKLRGPRAEEAASGNGWCPCLCELRAWGLCRGAYGPELLAAWDEFAGSRATENDRPDCHPETQVFCVLALTPGGPELADPSWRFSGPECRSLLLQVAFALAVGEAACNFEHRDLHWGNVLVQRLPEAEAGVADGGFVLRGEPYEVERHGIPGPEGSIRTHKPRKSGGVRWGSLAQPEKPSADFRSFCIPGIHVTLIDFSLSRLYTPDGIKFYDLAGDPEVFKGPEDDDQSETYRRMEQVTKGRWEEYWPETNVLWLQHLAKVLADHRGGLCSPAELRGLDDFRLRAGSYASARQSLSDPLFQDLCRRLPPERRPAPQQRPVPTPTRPPVQDAQAAGAAGGRAAPEPREAGAEARRAQSQRGRAFLASLALKKGGGGRGGGGAAASRGAPLGGSTGSEPAGAAGASCAQGRCDAHATGASARSGGKELVAEGASVEAIAAAACAAEQADVGAARRAEGPGSDAAAVRLAPGAGTAAAGTARPAGDSAGSDAAAVRLAQASAAAPPGRAGNARAGAAMLTQASGTNEPIARDPGLCSAAVDAAMRAGGPGRATAAVRLAPLAASAAAPSMRARDAGEGAAKRAKGSVSDDVSKGLPRDAAHVAATVAQQASNAPVCAARRGEGPRSHAAAVRPAPEAATATASAPERACDAWEVHVKRTTGPANDKVRKRLAREVAAA
ncbi:unnamed protein product, partial [Prorocentrum cordatum]